MCTSLCKRSHRQRARVDLWSTRGTPTQAGTGRPLVNPPNRRIPLQGGASLDLFGTYSWISEVYYSPFESEEEKADGYDRVDLRATFTSGNGSWIISGFVNNVFDDVGVLQILREGEQEFFRHTAGTTIPRHYGLEVTFQTGRY